MQTIWAFVWFVWQAVNVGGLGAWIFCLALAVIGLAMVPAWLWRGPVSIGRVWLLALMPLTWIFLGLWGGHYWVDWQAQPFRPNPGWVFYPLYAMPVVLLVLGISLVVYIDGIRAFTSLFLVLNLYFMLVVALMSAMAMSGNWL